MKRFALVGLVLGLVVAASLVLAPRSGRTTAATAPSVQFYAGEMTTASGLFIQSETALQPLLAAPQFGVASWQEDVLQQVAVWNAVATFTATLTPPPGFASANATVVAAFAAYGQAADDVRAGIDQQDATQFTAATQAVDQGTTLLQQATAAMGLAGAGSGMPMPTAGT